MVELPCLSHQNLWLFFHVWIPHTPHIFLYSLRRKSWYNPAITFIHLVVAVLGWLSPTFCVITIFCPIWPQESCWPGCWVKDDLQISFSLTATLLTLILTINVRPLAANIKFCTNNLHRSTCKNTQMSQVLIQAPLLLSTFTMKSWVTLSQLFLEEDDDNPKPWAVILDMHKILICRGVLICNYNRVSTYNLGWRIKSQINCRKMLLIIAFRLF